MQLTFIWNDMKFANSHISEICEFSNANRIDPKSLRICNSWISKNICVHLCKFATRVNDTDGKFAASVKFASSVKFAAGVKFSAVVNDTSGKLPLVNDTGGKFAPSVSDDTGGAPWAANISSNFFFKISNGPHGILRGLGETDSWKTLKSKISWYCPFKLPFAHTKLYIVKATDLVALFL